MISSPLFSFLLLLYLYRLPIYYHIRNSSLNGKLFSSGYGFHTALFNHEGENGLEDLQKLLVQNALLVKKLERDIKNRDLFLYQTNEPLFVMFPALREQYKVYLREVKERCKVIILEGYKSVPFLLIFLSYDFS